MSLPTPSALLQMAEWLQYVLISRIRSDDAESHVVLDGATAMLRAIAETKPLEAQWIWREREDNSNDSYQTLPWVGDFLNRRYEVVQEMKALGKKKVIPGLTEQLADWVRRLEVPSEFDAFPLKQQEKPAD